MPLVGHQKILAFFENGLEKQNLAHAYCFVGRDQVGKRTVANHVASKLLGVAPDKLATHPDYYIVSRQEDEKTGKLKQDISAAQARQLKEYASRRAWLGGWKVAVIDEAERLNKESGNALLKNLEEANAKNIFFLLAEDDSALLPTIRSRCQLFYFSPVAEAKIYEHLKNEFPDAAAEAAKLAMGRPGLGINLARDTEFLQKTRDEIERWRGLIGQPLHVQLNKLNDFLAEKDETGRKKDELLKVFELWEALWREATLARMGASGTLGILQAAEAGKLLNFSLEKIKTFLDFLKKARALLRQNVNQKLLMEELMLAWPC